MGKLKNIRYVRFVKTAYFFQNCVYGFVEALSCGKGFNTIHQNPLEIQLLFYGEAGAFSVYSGTACRGGKYMGRAVVINI